MSPATYVSQLDATVLSALASAMSATMSLSLRRYGRSGGRYAATDAYERNDSPRSGSPRCSGVCSTGRVKRESQPPRSSRSSIVVTDESSVRRPGPLRARGRVVGHVSLGHT